MPRFNINVRVMVEIDSSKQPMDQVEFAEPWIIYDWDDKSSDGTVIARADCLITAEGADKLEAIAKAKANAPALFIAVPPSLAGANVWVDDELEDDAVQVTSFNF
jgi:hypothetical protein